jgi:hypothetical protein
MPRLLSESEQEDIFRSKIAVSLDNFSLAWRVAELLIEYYEAGLPPPRATVRLLGDGRSVEIPGQNCGFFTTPVYSDGHFGFPARIGFFWDHARLEVRLTQIYYEETER